MLVKKASNLSPLHRGHPCHQWASARKALAHGPPCSDWRHAAALCRLLAPRICASIEKHCLHRPMMFAVLLYWRTNSGCKLEHRKRPLSCWNFWNWPTGRNGIPSSSPMAMRQLKMWSWWMKKTWRRLDLRVGRGFVWSLPKAFWLYLGLQSVTTPRKCQSKFQWFLRLCFNLKSVARMVVGTWPCQSVVSVWHFCALHIGRPSAKKRSPAIPP